MSACRVTADLQIPKLLESKCVVASMSLTVEQAMRAFEPALPLGVGFSGGADSTALLLACARKWPKEVFAFHVNHGLQPAAIDFELHCKRICESLAIPLRVLRVDAQAAPGQSPEDAARTARYSAFMAAGLMDTASGTIKSIALAHHADDQVETLLLALSRGAGVAGLSAMPAHWRRSELNFYRPFLQTSSSQLRDWLRTMSVPWIDDPSNTDTRFTRNRIRARLMPVLEDVFPQFRTTLARSALHAAEAQHLLDVLAQQDWELVASLSLGGPLIRAMQKLSPPRQSNVLRYWLKVEHQVIPSTAQLDELRRQLQACTTRGHHIRLKVGAGFVQRNGAVLAWYNI